MDSEDFSPSWEARHSRAQFMAAGLCDGGEALHITADLEAERGQRQGSYVTFKVSPQ